LLEIYCLPYVYCWIVVRYSLIPWHHDVCFGAFFLLILAIMKEGIAQQALLKNKRYHAFK
jgi:hypothetical protein